MSGIPQEKEKGVRIAGRPLKGVRGRDRERGACARAPDGPKPPRGARREGGLRGEKGMISTGRGGAFLRDGKNSTARWGV